MFLDDASAEQAGRRAARKHSSGISALIRLRAVWTVGDYPIVEELREYAIVEYLFSRQIAERIYSGDLPPSIPRQAEAVDALLDELESDEPGGAGHE
jgi:hypothetical protein